MSGIGPSLRSVFGLPEDVAYLAAAHWAPMAEPVAAAADAANARRRAPWTFDADELTAAAECARSLAAGLIGAQPGDVAIVGSVSYAMATAARNIRLARGCRVLLLEGEHPSNSLVWQDLAREQGAVVQTVPCPANGDWTAAILERIDAPDAPPVGLAALCQVHWAWGGTVDLGAIALALRRQGALLVIDATQSAGILPIDVRQVAPDYLAFPLYKWLCGPYGIAFLYAAADHQDGVPIEQTMKARVMRLRDGQAASAPYIATARRFDRGERDDVMLVPVATAALEFSQLWRRPEPLAALGEMTRGLANELAALGLPPSMPGHGVPHFVSVRPRGQSADTVSARLREAGVHVSPRLGLLRISPHIYNDVNDLKRLIAALKHVLNARN